MDRVLHPRPHHTEHLAGLVRGGGWQELAIPFLFD
jgi:hypothetical protein